MCLLFSKIVFFLKNFVSLCLIRMIQSVFRSIEIVLNFLKEASICFDQSKLIFDQSKVVNQFFLKRQIWLIQTYFSKVLFKLFSLSKLDKAHLPIFCRFPPDFLQGFPLSKPVSLFCPSFCILVQVFMHFYMNFMGIFGTFQIGIFVDSSFFFWNWSLGFVPIML